MKNNSKLKMIFILTILLFLYTTICAFTYAQNVSNNISNSVFRLHVIANSNSDEDQNLKYKVRDRLIQYMNSMLSSTSTKQDAINIANSHLEEFKQVALKVVQEEGFEYDVKVSVGNFEFPTKEYGDITLPAGYYDALKVEIGQAEGKNWWFVMFPPLCFVDVTSGVVPEKSKSELKNNLSDEEFALVSNNKNNGILFKFKILEFFNNNGFITAKK
ncbi:MAG: stage II sporulation protein R [Clostridia bacterium]|nr:stage II sporulation protein R [Clostridia bacterium]